MMAMIHHDLEQIYREIELLAPTEMTERLRWYMELRNHINFDIARMVMLQDEQANQSAGNQVR